LKQYRQGAGTGLSDPTIEIDIQPQGRDIWASHFKYYRVLHASFKLTFITDAKTDPDQDKRPEHNSFLVGYELTDEDGEISDNMEMFMLTKHAKRQVLKPCMTNHYWNGTTTRSTYQNPSTTSLTYVYNPNSWDYHVEEQGSEERWTPIKQNPSIDHELNVRCMHMDASTAPTGNISLFITCNYTVQFREATDSFFKTRSTAVATYGGTGEDPTDD
jgi:hypothetical protein